jgi:hypothetical protein
MLRRIAAAFTLFEGFADRLVCVLGAIFAAQAPEFFQQYLQRLGGHLAEINRQLAAFEAAAKAAGKPWAQFIADTAANPDPGLAKLGATMADTAARADSLTAAHAALLDATVWTRPWAFVAHLDISIARATAAVFKPAVPTTVEGAVYAAVGVGVAFGLWHFLVRLPLRRALLSGKSPTTSGSPVRR